MVNLKAEVIGIGTELLLGQIANTNAQWISKVLANQGISIYHHQVVGDNFSRIKEAFATANERSDLIFVTGGLGPTDDDLTREVLSEYTGRKLIEDSEIIDHLQLFFKKRKREMTTNNRKQAQVIEGATVIPNSAGTAPGLIVEHGQAHFIIMPGVPSEMKKMMEVTVLPFLREKFDLDDLLVSRMLHFIGIGESQLENEIKDIIDQQVNPTIAPLASEGEVALRLTAKAKSRYEADQAIEEVEQLINQRVGQYLYGYNEETIASAVVALLKQNELTLAAAESLTGGKFSDAIVSVSGASAVFKGAFITYSNEAKMSSLQIDQALIETYGAVSEETAVAMAKQTKDKLNTDLAISFTGVAGPDALEGIEPGTVFICLYQNADNYRVEQFSFVNHREFIRIRSVKKGLEWIHALLKAKSSQKL